MVGDLGIRARQDRGLVSHQTVGTSVTNKHATQDKKSHGTSSFCLVHMIRVADPWKPDRRGQSEESVLGLIVIILLPNRLHPASSASMETEVFPMRNDRSPPDMKSLLSMNPYEPGQTNVDMDPPMASLLGRPMASLVGFFVGEVSAGVVATVLTFIAIMPPINRLLHLDGEFDGLLLIMMRRWPSITVCSLDRPWGCSVIIGKGG